MTPDEYVDLIKSKLPGQLVVHAVPDLLTDTTNLVVDCHIRLYGGITGRLLDDDAAAIRMNGVHVEWFRKELRKLLTEVLAEL